MVSGSAGRNGFVYDATASKYVFGYRNSSGVGMYHTIDFSGTAFTSVSSAIQFVASTVDVSVAYLASQGKTIFIFSDGGSNEKGKGQVYTLATSNVSSFIGITNAAISSGATGEVAVKGGLSANQSSLTIGSTYYVQNNGTVSTSSSSNKAGKAISTTALNLVDPT